MSVCGDFGGVTAKGEPCQRPTNEGLCRAHRKTRKRGRPSTYSNDIGDAICARLADGESLNRICMDEDMPAESTVRYWALGDQGGFFAKYTRARMVQAHRIFDDMLVIADHGENDTYTDSKGNSRVDYDVIARSKLRVDTRKWYLSKLAPKYFGDKVAMEHSGPDGGPIEVSDLSDEELTERARQLTNRVGALVASDGPSANGKS